MGNSVKVRMARESNDDEDAKETSFTSSVHVLVVNFRSQKNGDWCRRIERLAQREHSMITKLIAKDVVANEVTGTDASFCNRLKCLSSRPTCAQGVGVNVNGRLSCTVVSWAQAPWNEPRASLSLRCNC